MQCEVCLHIHTAHGYTVIKPKQKHVEYYIILHIWFIISNQLAEDIISKLVKSRFNDTCARSTKAKHQFYIVRVIPPEA